MITIEARQLIALSTITSIENWRSALQCVCLRKKSRYIEAIATDSFSLARFINEEEQGEEEEEILIPKEVIKNLKAKDGLCEVSINDGIGKIDVGSCSFSFLPCESPYPTPESIERLFKKNEGAPAGEGTFDPFRMSAMCNVFAKGFGMSKKAAKALKIDLNNQDKNGYLAPALFSAFVEETEFNGLVMPMRD